MQHIHNRIFRQFKQISVQKMEQNYSSNKFDNVGAVVVANGQSMMKLLTETTAEDMDALWKVHVQNPARFISLVSPQLRQFEQSYVV